MSKRAPRRKNRPPPRRGAVVRADQIVDLDQAKQLADLRKTNVETLKIEAETAKLHTERKLMPWIGGATATGALLGTLLGLWKLLSP